MYIDFEHFDNIRHLYFSNVITTVPNNMKNLKVESLILKDSYIMGGHFLDQIDRSCIKTIAI